jgi:tetratricopeptide (TPR) repeat protein
MKAIATLLLTISTLLLAAPLPAQQSTQAVYNQGVALFNEERYDEALVLFEQVLQANPGFVYARNYAARCKTAMAQNLGPKNDLEGRLSRVIIPEIAFADAPIGDVLDYLASRTQEITKGETVVNFIYKGTPEQRTGTPITLSLRNVPLSEAIKYVGELSRSKVKYEPHAVVIDPNPGAAPAPAAGTAPAPTPGFAAPTPTTTPTSKSTFP